MEKRVVGLCRIAPSDCGIVFQGVYLAHIRHCVISDRSTLVLEELPQHCSMLCGNSLEIVCRFLRDKIPVVAQVEEGESRTGLHWVKLLNGNYDTLLLEEIAPEPLIANPDVQWTEDTPYGKVIYCAEGHPIAIAYDGQTNVNGIPIIKTVFRNTLEKLVEQGKATKKEYHDGVEYTITDQKIAEKIREHNIHHAVNGDNQPVIYKYNVPKHVLAKTIVIPL